MNHSNFSLPDHDSERLQSSKIPAKPAMRVVDVDLLHSFSELVLELGGDPEILLHDSRIDPEMLSRRGAVLEFRLIEHLFQHCADALACPDFGMRLAAMQDRGRALGPIGVVMKNSNTVAEAIRYCINNPHAHCIAWTGLEYSSPEHEAWRIDIGMEGLWDKRQALEHIMLLSAESIADMTGGAARPQRALLMHAPMAPPQTYQHFFGCDVSFRQNENALIFTETDLRRPILHPDAMIYEMATAFIATCLSKAERLIQADVRSLILRDLGREGCTNERIAAELRLHSRTLQRRLQAQGTSFEEIKDEARRDVAWHYIKQCDLPMTQVAERLGYSDASVLTRSCYRWFGASPHKIRTQPLKSPWVLNLGEECLEGGNGGEPLVASERKSGCAVKGAGH